MCYTGAGKMKYLRHVPAFSEKSVLQKQNVVERISSITFVLLR